MLRDSLSALLGTIPEINVVSVTIDLDSAYEFVSEHQPLVCIMDYSNQGGENMEKLDQMKSIRPEMKTIALVDEVNTIEVAEAVGFDKAVIKGASVGKLTNIISVCIQERMADLEVNKYGNHINHSD
jgi:DNA-binding NarL/FixJ family response regulator